MSNPAAGPLPSGTITFLFSDIEGSTTLVRELGRERYGALLSEHNALLRQAFAENGGVEIDRQGDAFFAVFESGGAAVAAAAAIQRALAAHTWEDGAQVRVRLGLHTGEADRRDGGYVGLAVHQASRIGDLGYGGQVLLSRTTAALVDGELPPDLRVRELRAQSLPGLPKPEPVFELVIDGLSEELPLPGTRRKLTAASGTENGLLLEREAELAAFEAYVHAALAGAGRLVAIEARAGMGKTRLLAELRRLAEGAGVTTLTARGAELEHDFAFGIVRQLFETTLAAAPPAEREELLDGPAARAATVFESASLEQAEQGATAVSFATLHALYWLAANVALRRPTLLVVDDLHWADAPSLRWLAHVQRRLDGLPLLVVCATRPPEQSREVALLTEILADPAAAVVRPAALTSEAVAALAGEQFAVRAEDVFVDACRQATGGNPLFLKALLDTLHREGVLPTAAEAVRVAEIGPEPVSRAVMLRLSRLPSEATALARAVAVLGNEVALHEAAALAGLDHDLASHTATALARADVLRIELPLEFTHPVVRASVYEVIDPPDRMEAHRRAAGLLAAGGAQPELVAAHLQEVPPAEDPFVVETLRRAAELALARGSSDVAISFLRRALAEPPPESERADLTAALGLAERLVDTEAAIVHLGEALDSTSDADRACRLALDLGRALQRSNRHAEAIDVLHRGVELCSADTDMAQSLTAELIGASWWEPEHLPIALEQVAAVREEELTDGDGGDLLRAVLAYAESRRGQDRERTVALAKAAFGSGRIPVTGSRAFYQGGYALTVAGRPELTIAAYEQGFLEALRRGDAVLAGGCLLFRALAHLHEGDLAAAEEALAAISEHSEFQMMRPYRAAYEAWIALERGLLDEAERLLAAAGLPETLPPNLHLMHFHLVRARTRFHRLGPEAGLADLEALGANSVLLQHENPAFLPWRPYTALALHAVGREKEAVALAREAVDLARGWGAERMLGVTLRTLGLVEGGQRGLDLLAEAERVHRSSSARLEHAKSLVELGAALRRANRRADARQFLRDGLDLAHRLGADALQEHAKSELAATGARPRSLTLKGPDSLTPSERRVAELALQSLTNKAIAQTLFVTPKTVEVHLSSTYRKLGISSRRELAQAIAGGE